MKKFSWMIVFLLVISNIFALSYSYERHSYDSSSQDTLWVSIAPKQCNNPWDSSSGRNEISQIKTYLDENNIDVFSVVIIQKDILTCSACNCPRGDIVYVLIDEDDYELAKQLGFNKSSKPSYSRFEFSDNNFFNDDFDFKLDVPRRSSFKKDLFEKRESEFFTHRISTTFCRSYFDGEQMRKKCSKF